MGSNEAPDKTLATKNCSNKTITHTEKHSLPIDFIGGEIMPFGVNDFILTANISLVLFKYFLFVSNLSVSPLLLPSSRPLHLMFKAAGAGICGPTGVTVEMAVEMVQPACCVSAWSERDSTGSQ